MTEQKPPALFNRLKLRGQIAQAAETFRGYEAAHRTKNPPDIAKALRNKEEAENLEAALADIDAEIASFTDNLAATVESWPVPSVTEREFYERMARTGYGAADDITLVVAMKSAFPGLIKDGGQ